jgi:hypothetical protein
MSPNPQRNQSLLHLKYFFNLQVEEERVRGRARTGPAPGGAPADPRLREGAQAPPAHGEAQETLPPQVQ